MRQLLDGEVQRPRRQRPPGNPKPYKSLNCVISSKGRRRHSKDDETSDSATDATPSTPRRRPRRHKRRPRPNANANGEPPKPPFGRSRRSRSPRSRQSSRRSPSPRTPAEQPNPSQSRTLQTIIGPGTGSKTGTEQPIWLNETRVTIDENDSFVNIFRQRIKGQPTTSESVEEGNFDQHEDDISFFMAPESGPYYHKHRASRIRDFCHGADGLVSSPGPLDETVKNLQAPMNWVDDTNWGDGGSYIKRDHEKVLSNSELLQILSEKRLNHPEFVDVHRRLIFSRDPNGATILALIRTAPPSQARAVADLIATYVDPQANIVAESSSRWDKSLNMQFHLPYFAIGASGSQDSRSFANGKGRLRCQYDLSFPRSSHDLIDAEAEGGPLKHVRIHKVVTSFASVSTCNERYWTAICLKDEYHEGEPRLQPEDELEEVDGSVDPITFKERSCLTSSPRTYFLQAMAENYDSVLTHKRHLTKVLREAIPPHISPEMLSSQEVRDWIEEMPSILKDIKRTITQLKNELNTFLESNVELGSDAIAQRLSDKDLKDPKLANKSMKALANSGAELGKIEMKFEDFIDRCDGFLRLLENENAELGTKFTLSHQNIAQMVNNTGPVQLIFEALSLIAQLYSGRPDGSSSGRNSTSFAIISVLIGVLAICAIVWMMSGRGRLLNWVHCVMGRA